MSNFVSARFGYSTLTLTMCAPSFQSMSIPIRIEPITDCTRGTGSQATGGGTRGTHLPNVFHSLPQVQDHMSSSRGRPRPPAVRAADAGDRMGRGSSLGQARDLRRWTICRDQTTGTHASYYVAKTTTWL